MPPSRTHFDANDRGGPVARPGGRGVASAFVRDRLWHQFVYIGFEGADGASGAAGDHVIRVRVNIGAIAKVSWTSVQRRDPGKTYHSMSVATLGKTARFPWRRLLANADLGNLDQVIVVENTAIPKTTGRAPREA